MIPKEHAEDLWLSYYHLIDGSYSNDGAKKLAKEYALICVNTTLTELENEFDTMHSSNRKEYWNEVKQELINF